MYLCDPRDKAITIIARAKCTRGKKRGKEDLPNPYLWFFHPVRNWNQVKLRKLHQLQERETFLDSTFLLHPSFASQEWKNEKPFHLLLFWNSISQSNLIYFPPFLLLHIHEAQREGREWDGEDGKGRREDGGKVIPDPVTNDDRFSLPLSIRMTFPE